MKKVLIILFVAIGAFASAQELKYDSVEQKMVFKKIVQVDSLNKDALFVKSKQWIIKKYSSSKKDIQVDDREEGTLVANGVLDFFGYKSGFNMTIEAKDGKSRISFRDFTLWMPADPTSEPVVLTRKTSNITTRKIEKKIKEIADSYEKWVKSSADSGW